MGRRTIHDRLLLGWALLAACFVTFAARAQDDNTTGAPEGAGQSETAEPDSRATPPDGDAASDDGDDAPPPETLDVGPIEERISSDNDVLQQLDHGIGRRESLFPHGPISTIRTGVQNLNGKLNEHAKLRVGLTYFSLFQYSTVDQAGPDGAASGDLDFFGRWTVFEGEGYDNGVLAFNMEDRHRYTDIPPSDLAETIGTIVETTRGFSNSGFAMNEVWWNQRLAQDRIGLRIGMINQKHFYDLHSFKSQKRYFLGAAFSDSPTIAFPANGLGARLRLSPNEAFHVTLGIGDANGSRSLDGLDTFFTETDFFSAIDVAFTPSINELRGRYSLTFWHTDPASTRGTPSGYGLTALIEQAVAPGIVPFARVGYGEGADLRVDRLVAVGLGLDHPFGADDDVAGIGGSWAHPSRVDTGSEWGLEVFYRFQLTPAIHLTPGAQFFFNPANNPNEDSIGLFQFRVGVVF